MSRLGIRAHKPFLRPKPAFASPPATSWSYTFRNYFLHVPGIAYFSPSSLPLNQAVIKHLKRLLLNQDMNPGQKHSVVGCINSSLGLHLEPLDLPRPTHRRLGSGRDTGEWEGGHRRALTQGKCHAGREQRRRLGAPSPQPPPSGFSGLGAESWGEAGVALCLVQQQLRMVSGGANGPGQWWAPI